LELVGLDAAAGVGAAATAVVGAAAAAVERGATALGGLVGVATIGGVVALAWVAWGLFDTCGEVTRASGGAAGFVLSLLARRVALAGVGSVGAPGAVDGELVAAAGGSGAACDPCWGLITAAGSVAVTGVAVWAGTAATLDVDAGSSIGRRRVMLSPAITARTSRTPRASLVAGGIRPSKLGRAGAVSADAGCWLLGPDR